MSDPFRYFRMEAAELLDALTTGLLAYERGDDPDALRILKRHAHTLKGAARVVGATAPADEAHTLEELLAEQFDANAVLARIDAIRRAVAELPAPSSAPQGASKEEPAPQPAVRGDESLGALERSLLGALSEVHAVRTLLDAAPPTRDPATARILRRLDEGITALAHTIAEAEGLARGLRLVPLRALVPALERAVRDASQVTGKRARLHVRGEGHRVDGGTLQALGEALDHVVRNAVVHGIEAPVLRRAAGKAEEGRIELSIDRRGGRLAIVCRDDGGGLDPSLLPEGMDPYQAIFRPGLSTARQVTVVSGRGVGLEVVAAIAERLGGEVRASPAPGGGLAIEMVVPISRLGMRVMVAQAGGNLVAVPLEGVIRAVELRDGAVGTSNGEGAGHVLIDGELLPRVPLAALFRGTTSTERTALVARCAEGPAALLVDGLVGLREVLARPMVAAAGPVPGVAALFLDTDGIPVPILDLDDLAALRRRAPIAASPSAEQAPILVVDDSLTTRMLERSILEAAGHEVHTASSGEEALELASRRDYALFVVDVQMPGMSGLELVRRVRQDSRLRHVPAILVTSLSSAEDRRRGLEAGADAYIVKSAFDQDDFLGIVASLVGDGGARRLHGRPADADPPEDT